MISVVTITRNNFEELVATINSVETLVNIELIVINGGSCLKTFDYLQKLRLPNANVKHLSEADTGIADAFNKGLRLAEGLAVVFLNSGDLLVDKDYFARSENYLLAHKDVGFVHASIIFQDQIAGDIELKPSLSTLGKGMPYRHQTMIIRKKVYDELGEFRTDLRATMDYEFVCRMHKRHIVGYYDRTRPVVLMDGSGISSTREWLAYQEVWKILGEHKLRDFENTYGSLVRCLKYAVRRLLVVSGMTPLLGHLKRLKHGTPKRNV